MIRSLQYLFIAIIVTTVGFSLYQWNASRASTQKTAPNNGLVGYWSFDEGTGTQAGDASGNGNTGTLTNGPTWTTGKLGQAINFDGVDDYVTIGTTGQSTNSFSFGAWIKTSATHEIDSEASSGFGGVSGQKYAFTPSYKASPSSGAGLSVGTNGISVYEHSDAYLPPLAVYSGTIGSGWNYIMIVYNSKTPSIYLNGVLVRTGLTSPKTTVYPPDHIDDITSYGSFAGQIDEVRIYNRALSGTEITNLYNLGAAKLNTSSVSSLTSGLVGYWTFDGKDTPWTSSSAGTATDRSGNGNTGTLTNMSQSTSPIIGKLGQALKFDGTSQYVNVGNNSVLNLTNNFSVSVWVNINSVTQSNYKRLFGRDQVDSNNRPLYIEYDYTANNYRAIWRNGGTFGVVVSKTLTAVQWQHFVVTFKDGVAKSYSDGLLIQSASGVVQPVSSSTDTYIGYGGTYYFPGSIDEVRVYNRELSATEVQSLYDLGASGKVNSSVSQNQGVGRLDSGLVGYWKLDDGSGTTATDSSTNANNGTLTGGPTWGTGKIGGAVDFTGQKYITIPNSTPLQVTGNMTVSFWIYHRSTFNSDWDPIVSKFNSDANNEFNIRARNSNEGQFYTGTGGGFITWDPDADIGLNRWTHVVARRNLNAGVMDMWFNGIKKRSGGSGAAVSSTTKPLQLGSGPDGGTVNRAFDGLLDEVRIYNRAITDDEIAQLYRLNQPSGTDTSLKGYWSFNGSDISGTTAYDRSGNANNGTLTNGPTPTIGKLGQALNFNGSSQYVSIGSAPTSSFPLTTSAWFKTTDATASYRSISSIYGSSNSAIAILQFDSGGGGCTNSKRVKYVVRDTSGGTSTSICSSSDLNDGVWHHIVGVSSSASNHTLYIDGVSQGNSTTSLGATAFNSMQVGCYTGGQYFPGSIDEVRVYNRALSSTEISALYNAGR